MTHYISASRSGRENCVTRRLTMGLRISDKKEPIRKFKRRARVWDNRRDGGGRDVHLFDMPSGLGFPQRAGATL